MTVEARRSPDFSTVPLDQKVHIVSQGISEILKTVPHTIPEYSADEKKRLQLISLFEEAENLIKTTPYVNIFNYLMTRTLTLFVTSRRSTPFTHDPIPTTWDSLLQQVIQTSTVEPPAASVILERVNPPFYDLIGYAFTIDVLENLEETYRIFKWRQLILR